MQRLVVVGASLAGWRAAEAAREAGFDGSVVIVGDEPHRPYTRPPLSKQLLAGAQSAEDCGFRCDTIAAEWRLGRAAVGLDRSTKTVLMADGEALSYDRLIIATGCRARPWTGSGRQLAGVHTLRGLDDARALRSALTASSRRLVIIGAGFIGCEVAATARAQRLDVTVVDVAPYPLTPLGPELGERCAAMHREHGVDLRCGTGVVAMHGDAHVEAVELTDGSRVGAGVVLVALGALPNTEWLTGSGLTLSPGVTCDPTLTAVDDPDILAAGDVCSWPHPLADGELVRVEHWGVAAEQGRLAGRNVLLDPADREPHVALPFFWSDQYDTKIQAVGFPARSDHLEIIEASPDGRRLVAVAACRGRLVGTVAFNAAKRLGWYRRRLADRPSLADIRAVVREDAEALGMPA